MVRPNAQLPAANAENGSAGDSGAVPPPIVRCRPDAGLWLIVILLAPFGVAMGMTPFSKPPAALSDVVAMWAQLGIFGALFLGLPGILAWWLLRGEIVADETRLCWRNLGRRHCARWDQVSDFYDCPVKSRKGKKARVETSAGRLTLLGESWKNTPLLRAAIEQRATAARVRHWNLLGARDEDPWPRRFDYDTAENRGTAWLLALGPALILLLQCGRALSNNGAARLDWPLFAASFTVYGVLLLVISWPALLVHQETCRRRAQRIIVTPDDLQLHDGDSVRVLKWEEITNYYSAREGSLSFVPRFVVESRFEQISFVSTIRECAVLREVIRQRARNGAAHEWLVRGGDEVLGGEAGRWSGGTVGMGQRVYHYRTRSNRAVLWLPSALCVIFLLMPRYVAGRSAADTGAMIFVTGVLALWGWWRFYRAAVLVGETSITHQGAFGRREMEWSAVREYSLIGGDLLQFIELKSAAGRLRFWYGVADLEELKGEISRRAVNSRTRGWNEL